MNKPRTKPFTKTASAPIWNRKGYVMDMNNELIDPGFDDLPGFEKQIRKRVTERGEV